MRTDSIEPVTLKIVCIQPTKEQLEAINKAKEQGSFWIIGWEDEKGEYGIAEVKPTALVERTGGYPTLEFNVPRGKYTEHLSYISPNDYLKSWTLNKEDALVALKRFKIKMLDNIIKRSQAIIDREQKEIETALKKKALIEASE